MAHAITLLGSNNLELVHHRLDISVQFTGNRDTLFCASKMMNETNISLEPQRCVKSVEFLYKNWTINFMPIFQGLAGELPPKRLTTEPSTLWTRVA